MPTVLHRITVDVKRGIEQNDPRWDFATSLYKNAVVALEFVSEDDVRGAVSDGRKLPVSAATVITPSARELGNDNDIFVRV